MFEQKSEIGPTFFNILWLKKRYVTPKKTQIKIYWKALKNLKKTRIRQNDRNKFYIYVGSFKWFGM